PTRKIPQSGVDDRQRAGCKYRDNVIVTTTADRNNQCPLCTSPSLEFLLVCGALHHARLRRANAAPPPRGLYLKRSGALFFGTEQQLSFQAALFIELHQ